MRLEDKQLDKVKLSIDKIYPFSDECWSEMLSFIEIREYQKNDYFSKEGEKLKYLGFVLSGILRIYYLTSKGEEWNKHFLVEGDFVASSILPDKESITNIQALSNTFIACVPYTKFSGLSKKYKEINFFIQKLSFNYLEQKEQREIKLLSEDALNRYLSFRKMFPNLEDNIQHYHIASYLGITPTQLSRIRQKILAHQQM